MPHKRSTKIIATIGPKSESYELLKELISTGIDIARMNFSHCTNEEYIARKKHIEDINRELGTNVKILQDLQGPRIRVGEMPKEGRKLIEGEIIVFTTEEDKNGESIYIDNADLPNDLSVGDPMYLVNGDIRLTVKDTDKDSITAVVDRGGVLYSRKAVNVPKTKLTLSGLTEKDIEDVKFALKEGVDYVAISFIQDGKDVRALREIVGESVKIIAKIETRLAVENIDEIIQEADAIMVARGDLGVEIPVEDLPFVQKHLVRNARWHNTPSIIATQMMMSMVENPQPTRAEVSDVYNAVYEGANAVMLSDETASGNYPVETVKTMAKIVQRAEEFKLGNIEGL